MKLGERIRVITECANSLADRKVSESQLILRTFGAETFDFEDQWNGGQDADEYFTGQCEAIDSAKLSELHQYLLGEDAAPGRQRRSDMWGDNPVRVFISHCHEDAVFASGVNDILRKTCGIDAFVAHRDINPSAQWRATIRGALDTAHFVVAILHDRFHASQWCDQEVGWALGRDLPVMPVRRQAHIGPRFDGFMEEHQDLVLDPTRGSGEHYLAWTILENVVKDERTHNIGVDALVEAFVNSPGWNRTRALWAMIEREPSFESRHLRRFEYAVETNRQVYDGNYGEVAIPVLLKALVEKFEPPPPSNPWTASADGTPPF